MRCKAVVYQQRGQNPADVRPRNAPRFSWRGYLSRWHEWNSLVYSTVPPCSIPCYNSPKSQFSSHIHMHPIAKVEKKYTWYFTSIPLPEGQLISSQISTPGIRIYTTRAHHLPSSYPFLPLPITPSKVSIPLQPLPINQPASHPSKRESK